MPKNSSYDSRIGFYITASLVLMTLLTFAIAINTPPGSGSLCTEGCVDYPYHDIVDRFPRDYLWMFPAIGLTLLYVLLFVSIHRHTADWQRNFSLSGLAFAIISAMVLVMDYFVQLAVIQPSLLQGETEGIALLTQYNPHGLFIALEEMGYLMMSLSFLVVAPVFFRKSRLERAVGWVFMISFFLVLGSLWYIIMQYGHARGYLFEVIVLSIDWLTLIIGGTLLSLVYRRTFSRHASA